MSKVQRVFVLQNLVQTLFEVALTSLLPVQHATERTAESKQE